MYFYLSLRAVRARVNIMTVPRLIRTFVIVHTIKLVPTKLRMFKSGTKAVKAYRWYVVKSTKVSFKSSN